MIFISTRFRRMPSNKPYVVLADIKLL